MPTGRDPSVIALGISDSPARRERELARLQRAQPAAPLAAGSASSSPAQIAAEPPTPSVPGPTEFIAAIASADLVPRVSTSDALRVLDEQWAPPPSGLSLTDRRV